MAVNTIIMKQFVTSIFLALLIGLGAALFFVQRDPWVKERVFSFVKNSYERSFDCTLDAELASVNFFWPQIELGKVRVKPRNNSPWAWHAQKVVATCSWWQLFQTRAVNLHVSLHDLQASSEYSGSEPAIMEHIYKYVDGPPMPIPLNVKTLACYRSSLDLHHGASDTLVHLVWNSESKNMGDTFKSTIRLQDGQVMIGSASCAQKVHGTVYTDLRSENNKLAMQGSSNCTVELPHLQGKSKQCALTGSWNERRGEFALHNNDHSFVTDALTISQEPDCIAIHTKARVPLTAFWRCLPEKVAAHAIDGTCLVDAQARVNSNGFTVQGNCQLNDLNWNGGGIGSCLVIYQKNNQMWQGTAQAQIPLLGALNGSWQWDQQKTNGSLSLANPELIALGKTPGWQMQPAAVNVACSVDSQGKVDGQLSAALAHAHNKKSLRLGAQVTVTPEQCTVQTTINDKKVRLVTNPELPTQLTGKLPVELARELLAVCTDYEVQGEGAFNLRLDLASVSSLEFALAPGGTLRLPQTYNVINGCSGKITYDHAQRCAQLHGAACNLYKGSVHCDNAIVRFDEQFAPIFMQLPVRLESCMLNFKKDIFAMVGGHLLFEQRGQAMPHLAGTLILEHCQFHENIFSDAFQQQVRAYAGNSIRVIGGTDSTCDITLETMAPLSIKTALLDTAAKGALHITNTLRAPQISGSLSLLSGSLYFPYKALHITKGSLYFMPQQSYDPFIELVAKNRIKNHNVTLHVSGSMQHPNVTIESSPPLTQEQIVALLLVGSQDESLNILMPTLLMNNLSSIVFGNQSSNAVQRAFNKILTPLKRIHVMPRFTDQSGRGGLRGALEIEVTDRLHAMIQKNFSLTEDTLFELDYLLSDDISMRAIRNERRDVSGEVEMRWKF